MTLQQVGAVLVHRRALDQRDSVIHVPRERGGEGKCDARCVVIVVLELSTLQTVLIAGGELDRMSYEFYNLFDKGSREGRTSACEE